MLKCKKISEKKWFNTRASRKSTEIKRLKTQKSESLQWILSNKQSPKLDILRVVWKIADARGILIYRVITFCVSDLVNIVTRS